MHDAVHGVVGPLIRSCLFSCCVCVPVLLDIDENHAVNRSRPMRTSWRGSRLNWDGQPRLQRHVQFVHSTCHDFLTNAQGEAR